MNKPCKRCNGSGVEPDLKKLGASIRKARLAKGLSLQDVADRVGCSRAYLCDIEHGRRSIGGDKAGAIVRMLG